MDKNNFVTLLENHFSEIYGFKASYVYGAREFEGKKIGSGYGLVRKNPEIEKDLRGFSFRKDFCKNHSFLEKNSLTMKIDSFAKTKGIETNLNEHGTLTLTLGDKNYIASPHIGKEPSDEVSIFLMNCLLS